MTTSAEAPAPDRGEPLPLAVATSSPAVPASGAASGGPVSLAGEATAAVAVAAVAVAASGVNTPSVTRVWRPDAPVSVGATLASMRREPCMRMAPGEPVWRATLTPDGPALQCIVSRPQLGEIESTVWGPGGAWLLDGLPELLGAADDHAAFEPRPEHPTLVGAWRARPNWRVPRTRAVFEALVPAALEQKVTGLEARRSYAQLVRAYGTPAPGPANGLFVPPGPDVWKQIPSWVWLKAGVDEARRRVVIQAARVAGRLEETAGLPHAEANRRLRTVPGIGIWTSAEVRQRAHGDPDAFSWMDYHVAKNVSYALTGTVLDDAGCAEVIECYRGHRYRVQRLLELEGVARPRRGPRMTLPTHLPR